MNIERTDNFMKSLGVEVYRVGGSVRDELLGRMPKDADYMVRGVPLDDLGIMLKMYGKVTPLRLRQGGQFGWRLATKGIGSIEIALPRTERSTGNGRQMSVKVDPNMSLAEDAKRRDFTFNALYKIVHEGRSAMRVALDGSPIVDILDPTEAGLFDLERRYIRTTHPGSFRDDPLRMLRALRFVARGFDLASVTETQMAIWAEQVGTLTENGYTSGTLLDELQKILMGTFVAEALHVARDTGVLKHAIPELAPMIGFDQGSKYHDLTTDDHTFKALAAAAKWGAPLRVRMALLFHDSGKPGVAWTDGHGRKHYYGAADNMWISHEQMSEEIWREFAQRVNAPRRLREDVATLIREHMVAADKVRPSKVRRERVRLGHDMLRDLYWHRVFDAMGKGKPNHDHLRNLDDMMELLVDAKAAGVPESVKDLAISGNDVRDDLGIFGKQVGDVLRAVLDEVVTQPDERRLSREWQLQAAERIGRALA
jgi:tRNA nucleotidyltransferase (CCA-adding enzyme)